MEPQGFHRKLTAIVSADATGFSRLNPYGTPAIFHG